MRFRALGPVQVWDGTSWAGIRAPQQRLVLAILLTQPNRVVSLERLVREIWPYDPPRAAASTIQTYMLRLRRLFGERTLLTKGSGYQLVVSGDDIDIQVFERLVSTGRQALAQGRLAAGVDRLSAALALWRGPAMAGVPESPTVAAEAARLELHRVAAFEDQAEARLALGRHAGVVDEARRLIQEHPFRERLLGQLMLALYRCGRPMDALETYRQGRRLLRDELGLDPCPELRRLERAIRDGNAGLTTTRDSDARLTTRDSDARLTTRDSDARLTTPTPVLARAAQLPTKAGPPPMNTKRPLAQHPAAVPAMNSTPPVRTNTAPPLKDTAPRRANTAMPAA